MFCNILVYASLFAVRISRDLSSSSSGSIGVASVLTYCALVYPVCDLRAAQMTVQYCLIRKLLIYFYFLRPAPKRLGSNQKHLLCER